MSASYSDSLLAQKTTVSAAVEACRRIRGDISSGVSIGSAYPDLEHVYSGLVFSAYCGTFLPDERAAAAGFVAEFVGVIVAAVGALIPDDLAEHIDLRHVQMNLASVFSFVEFGLRFPEVWGVLVEHLDFAALARATDLVFGSGGFRSQAYRLYRSLFLVSPTERTALWETLYRDFTRTALGATRRGEATSSRPVRMMVAF